MAVVNIKYACGCGKCKTNDVSQAVDHVEKTGHTITAISGSIKR